MSTAYILLNKGVILNEIRLLKETNARQENTIKTLENKVKDHEDRVKHLENSQPLKINSEINQSNDVTTFNDVREKRPARLLPLSLFRK